MSMTYYTVDDLRPGRPGWDVRQFSALAEAIDHYRTLPMDGTRVLGMTDDAHAYELIRLDLTPGREKAAASSTCAELPGRRYVERRCLPLLRAGALGI